MFIYAQYIEYAQYAYIYLYVIYATLTAEQGSSQKWLKSQMVK